MGGGVVGAEAEGEGTLAVERSALALPDVAAVECRSGCSARRRALLSTYWLREPDPEPEGTGAGFLDDSKVRFSMARAFRGSRPRVAMGSEVFATDTTSNLRFLLVDASVGAPRVRWRKRGISSSALGEHVVHGVLFSWMWIVNVVPPIVRRSRW